MQVKLLKDVVSIVAGNSSAGLVDLLYEKVNVNEFLIAKKLKLTINQTRNILYKLAEEGLVSFIRKKDKKNGGWYTYFWTLDVPRSLTVLRKKLIDETGNLNSQLSSKQMKRFYYCSNCDIEMSEENALIHDFTCQECGEVFQVKDNAQMIKETESKIEELGKKLGFVDQELEVLNKKHEVVKERRRKTEERKKKTEREERRKQRDKEKKKAMGSKSKKIKKKKFKRFKKQNKKKSKKKARKK